MLLFALIFVEVFCLSDEWIKVYYGNPLSFGIFYCICCSTARFTVVICHAKVRSVNELTVSFVHTSECVAGLGVCVPVAFVENLTVQCLIALWPFCRLIGAG